ncbi:MAG: hypothetical protein ACRDWY_17790 [Actinomycetes bacterium]
MIRPANGLAGLRAAALVTGLVLSLAACGAATADQSAGPGGPGGGKTASPTPEGPDPSDRPDPALSGQPVPTLPPGDPGTGPDAEGTTGSPDDRAGSDGHTGGHSDHDEGGVTSVPVTATVDTETVAALAGGTWVEGDAGWGGCETGRPAGATASRTLALTSAEGRLVQTVSAHETVRAARDAVDAVADRLAGCGFTGACDPRLGEASAEMSRISAAGQTERALVVATEGATVLLVGVGSSAADGAWESLADVAMGTACAAGVHGCH